MLLRASGQATGDPYELSAIVDAEAAERSGVPHAEALLELADAMVGEDEAALVRARERVEHELDADALVDAVAIASNFERMVRIADATGIPLDEPTSWVGADLREQLGLDRFSAAQSTPLPTRAQRLIGRLLRPLLPGLFRRVGRRVARRRAAPR